jgi:hypothetical protein
VNIYYDECDSIHLLNMAHSDHFPYTIVHPKRDGPTCKISWACAILRRSALLCKALYMTTSGCCLYLLRQVDAAHVNKAAVRDAATTEYHPQNLLRKVAHARER